MIRTTCYRCEQDGVVTALVPVGRWGCCPLHEAEYLRSLVADGWVLVPVPQLRERGIPAR